MQTPKARNSSTETPQKVCPRAISSEVARKISPRSNSAEVPLKLSPRVVRQLKTTSQDSDSSASSSTRASRTPKDRSTKVVERKSPRSPASEVQKKHPSKAAELEFQVSQLQNDLKKVKDQLSCSEAEKKQAEQDAEESKKQLLEMSLKLEESQKQLPKTNSEAAVVIEPQNASEDQDLALESQIEAIKKQHSIDSAALASAVNEIKELKIQLETVAESEAAQTKRVEQSQTELNGLKLNLTETLALVEDMKNQLIDCKKSEAEAQALVGETLMQLETAKRTVESLRSDGVKAVVAYDTIASELEQSRARVNLLEELVSELKAGQNDADSTGSQTAGGQHMNKLEAKEHEELENSNEAELTSLKSEIEQLRSALEASEIKYNEEQTKIAAEIKSAYELIGQIKSSSIEKEAALEMELQKTIAEVEELKANLMDKETELQGICEENDDLHQRLESMLSGWKKLEHEKEIQRARAEVERVKANLMDRETELQNIVEENEMLKLEMKKRENKGKVDDEIAVELEATRAAEREALMKLGYMTEEVDKSNRRVARVSEQLDAAQAANSEMEAELRRLKVQSDQWRKAAEAAAAMLSTGNNGKFMDRTGSMDNRYSPRSARIPSPYSDDGDDDLLKKKNPNMLKKIGVLWRKPQK